MNVSDIFYAVLIFKAVISLECCSGDDQAIQRIISLLKKENPF